MAEALMVLATLQTVAEPAKAADDDGDEGRRRERPVVRVDSKVDGA